MTASRKASPQGSVAGPRPDFGTGWESVMFRPDAAQRLGT
jgi:hypothetical protein